MSFIDNAKLNPSQLEAVTTIDGPLLVLAGAGSGKTRVLTHRVAHMILDNNIKPWNILAITFTNKAAKEMHHRIIEMCGDDAKGVLVSTFHSACARFLRMDITRIGYDSSFSIYDDDDQDKLLDKVLKQLELSSDSFPKRELKSKISDAKNKMLSFSAASLHWGGDARAETISKIYELYESELKRNNALDFDDLIIKTIVMFKECPDILDKYRSKFQYILVDEYQDTNHAQYLLVHLLSKEHKNICVVGDDDQSIYGWRGADISNILSFEKDNKNAKIVKLEQNYRSTNTILTAANSIISQNTGRKEKSLWSSNGDGDKIILERLPDERSEAVFICEQIQELIKTKGYKYKDFAVLYRTNAQSRVVEDIFMGSGIPYNVYGGMKFYDRKEVKDVIAYLRMLINPNDEMALRRIINVPKRGIGSATIEELVQVAAANEDTLFGVILDVDKYQIKARSLQKIRELGQLIIGLYEALDTMTLSDFVKYTLDKTGLLAQYAGQYTEEARDRTQNLQEFVTAITEYAESFPEATLQDYLETVALVSDTQGEDTKIGVSMMTLHSAKGLEFPAVFLAGMEEGIFPLSRAAMDPLQLEEERRLCYVGVTRAMQHLFIITCAQRMLYGQRKYQFESRFLKEIPQELIISTRADSSHTRQGIIERVQKNKKEQKSYNIGKVEVMQAAQPTVKSTNEYSLGDKIIHKSFGEGTIISVNGNGRNATIKIAFSDNGIKELAASFAGIEKKSS